MTKSELSQKHHDADEARADHALISIEYSLQTLDNAYNGGEIINIIYDKMEELRNER